MEGHCTQDNNESSTEKLYINHTLCHLTNTHMYILFLKWSQHKDTYN